MSTRERLLHDTVGILRHLLWRRYDFTIPTDANVTSMALCGLVNSWAARLLGSHSVPNGSSRPATHRDADDRAFWALTDAYERLAITRH